MELSPRQKRILRFIRDASKAKGYPPSFTDIANHIGMAVSTTDYHLRVLKAALYVTWQPDANRTLVVTQAGLDFLEEEEEKKRKARAAAKAV